MLLAQNVVRFFIVKLSAAVFASDWVINGAGNGGYEIEKICQDLDAVYLMAYDFHGSWESTANHHASLHGVKGDAVNVVNG